MMAPDKETRQFSDQELDKLAYRVADLCREIRGLRTKIAELAENEFGENRESQIASLCEQIESRESSFTLSFSVIQSELKELVAKQGLHGEDSEVAVLEAEAKIRLTIHKFFALAPSTSVRGSRFRGWLRRVVMNTIIDRRRVNDKGGVRSLNRRFQKELLEKYGETFGSVPDIQQFPLESIGDGNRRTATTAPSDNQRPSPTYFTDEEVQQIARLPELCQILFLFSTGLWHCLSPDNQQRWREAELSPFELTRLNAIARANRFVLKSVEDELARGPIHWDAVNDTEIEDKIRKKANMVAQSLNRHFWKFMKLDTTWQCLFKFIEPMDEGLIRDVENCLDNELMLGYLQCDVYMRCDTATRCFEWLEQCGCENSLVHNLGRVAGQQPLVFDSRSSIRNRINDKKWNYACHFAGVDPKAISAELFLRLVFSERLGPHGRGLPLSVAEKRKHVDLPLAFERVHGSALQHGDSEASDE